MPYVRFTLLIHGLYDQKEQNALYILGYNNHYIYVHNAMLCCHLVSQISIPVIING